MPEQAAPQRSRSTAAPAVSREVPRPEHPASVWACCSPCGGAGRALLGERSREGTLRRESRRGARVSAAVGFARCMQDEINSTDPELVRSSVYSGAERYLSQATLPVVLSTATRSPTLARACTRP